jgi:hypothetical protein
MKVEYTITCPIKLIKSSVHMHSNPLSIDGDLQVDLRSQSILIDIQLETTPRCPGEGTIH